MIYKLDRFELTQAVADFLTKKYMITDKFDANMNIQIDSKTGNAIVEVSEGVYQ